MHGKLIGLVFAVSWRATDYRSPLFFVPRTTTPNSAADSFGSVAFLGKTSMDGPGKAGKPPSLGELSVDITYVLVDGAAAARAQDRTVLDTGRLVGAEGGVAAAQVNMQEMRTRSTEEAVTDVSDRVSALSLLPANAAAEERQESGLRSLLQPQEGATDEALNSESASAVFRLDLLARFVLFAFRDEIMRLWVEHEHEGRCVIFFVPDERFYDIVRLLYRSYGDNDDAFRSVVRRFRHVVEVLSNGAIRDPQIRDYVQGHSREIVCYIGQHIFAVPLSAFNPPALPAGCDKEEITLGLWHRHVLDTTRVCRHFLAGAQEIRSRLVLIGGGGNAAIWDNPLHREVLQLVKEEWPDFFP